MESMYHQERERERLTIFSFSGVYYKRLLELHSLFDLACKHIPLHRWVREVIMVVKAYFTPCHGLLMCHGLYQLFFQWIIVCLCLNVEKQTYVCACVTLKGIVGGGKVPHGDVFRTRRRYFCLKAALWLALGYQHQHKQLHSQQSRFVANASLRTLGICLHLVSAGSTREVRNLWKDLEVKCD